MAFFADLESRLRIHLRHIEINQYVKKDAKTALAFLAEAKNLNHLRIETGMAMDDDTAKVAKAFWLDASKLLEAVGSVKEKMMVEDKPKPQAAKPKDEASSDEDSSSEDEEGEDSDGEEEDDDEEEAGDEEVEESKESKATTSSVARSEVVHDGTVNPANLELSNNANETETIVVASAVIESEDTVIANNGDNITTDDAVKKDSKSPTPAVATKKVATPKPSPKLRQGRKADAIDILQFGKAAFKYKDEGKSAQNWDASMRAEFLDALRAKLK